MNPLRILSAVFGLFLVTVTSVSAQTLLLEPFDGTPGTVPDDWVLRWRGTGTARVGAIADFSNNVSANQRGFLIQRTATGTSPSNSSANLFYTGATPLSETGSMSDFTGEIKLTFEGATSVNRGVLLRAQSTSAYAPVDGYYLAINSSSLGLYHNPISHTEPGTVLGSDDFTAAIGTEYRLTFTFEGSDFSASLYNGLTEVASLSLDLSEAKFDDLTLYNSGFFGLRTGYGSAASTYFYDLKIDAVPEPGIVALLGLGAAAVFGAARRRGKNITA